MKKILFVLVLCSLGGCRTVSQKAPDPFGLDLHHKMDFLEPREVVVVYPAQVQNDGSLIGVPQK